VDVSEPLATVIPGVQGRVLAVLARTTRPLTGRQISRQLAGLASQRGVQNALNELVAGGLALREDHPPIALYVLNRGHIAAAAINELANLRTALLERMRGLIGGWSIQPERTVLFGSAARRSGDELADIDVVVVRPAEVPPESREWQAQLAELRSAVAEWTGNPCNTVEYTADDLAALDPADPVATGIFDDGIVITRAQPDA
jgi:predicted nucleotidyltransferase